MQPNVSFKFFSLTIINTIHVIYNTEKYISWHTLETVGIIVNGKIILIPNVYNFIHDELATVVDFKRPSSSTGSSLCLEHFYEHIPNENKNFKKSNLEKTEH